MNSRPKAVLLSRSQGCDPDVHCDNCHARRAHCAQSSDGSHYPDYAPAAMSVPVGVPLEVESTMNLRAVCMPCGDVPVSGPAVAVHPRRQPEYWRCSFVCPTCGSPRENAVAPAAGLFLVASGAAVVPGPRAPQDIDFIGTDDVAEFRQALDAVVSVDELFVEG